MRQDTPVPTLTGSLARKAPTTARGEALRRGLQKMGVFFVKIGQTAAQRPDIVGDEVRRGIGSAGIELVLVPRVDLAGVERIAFHQGRHATVVCAVR